MSWVHQHYLRYCLRLGTTIVEKKLSGKKLKSFLDKKWEYVNRRVGDELEKESFIENMEDMVQIRKSLKNA